MPEITDRDFYLGMGAIIQAFDPTMKMMISGVELPKIEKESEYIRFDLLGRMPMPSRRNQVDRHLMFQLICYSNESEFKKGDSKRFDRHYELADIYSQLFDQKDYYIKNTCIRFQESKIAYLDLRTSTFTAKSISTGTTPSLQTQSAVIITDGRIITNKD